MGGCIWLFRAVPAFQLAKKLLMILCRKKGAGTLVSVLAGWDGAQDMLDQTNSQSDISPGKLLVWIFWHRGSNSGINCFFKVASFAVVVSSSRTAPLLQQWFPRGQMMESVNKLGWMESFDSLSSWFVQLGWWWQKQSPGYLILVSEVRGGMTAATITPPQGAPAATRDVKPKGRLGFSAAPSALQVSPGGNLLPLCFSTAK